MRDRVDVPDEVSKVVDALIMSMGDNLKAVIWQGSWARGEATAESDHDLIVVLRHVDDESMLNLRDIFAGRHGWSAYVKTEPELAEHVTSGRLQFHFGTHILYGQFEPPKLTPDTVLDEIRSLAATVNHECRYRVMHGAARAYAGLEPDYVRERNLRWMYYMAKAVVLALKAREYYVSGTYPVTRAELRERVADPNELEVIDTVDRWPDVKRRYVDDITQIALRIDAVARGLTTWLTQQAPT